MKAIATSRYLALLGVMSGMLLILAACDSVVTAVDGVRIQDFPEGPMAVGETARATAEVLGRGSLEQTRVNWFSEDTFVARVTPDGEIEAVSAGETQIAAAYGGHTEIRRLVVVPALAIESDPPPAGEVGEGYSHALQATGGAPPYRWDLAQGSLPPGLSLPSDGALTGTPEEAGTWSFQVRVRDAADRSVDAQLSITVEEAPQITTGDLSRAQVGEPYRVELAAAGGRTPYSWSLEAGSLPNGLSLSTDGVLGGTPMADGAFEFTVRVTGANDLSSSAPFELEVERAPVASVTLSPDSASVDVGSAVQFAATLRDAQGRELTDRSATWRSSDTAVARVDDTGLVTGVSMGTVVISATSEGVTGSADLVVIVTQPPSILEADMRWVTGVDQCGPGFRDGRTRHEVRFRLPFGVSSVDEIEVEVEYRATTAEGAGSWGLRSIETDWTLMSDNGTWTALRPAPLCWNIGSAVLWFDKRLRIRLTPDAPWSDWAFSRLFLADRPAQTLGRIESGERMVPVDALRVAPGKGAVRHNEVDPGRMP